jgi:acyl dehydratase
MAINPNYLLGMPPRVTHHTFARRDTMLYALGIGAGQDPADTSELNFVYEEGLKALPTMAVVLAYPGFWQREPQYGIDWKRLLHGEQSVTFHAVLPIEGEVRGELTIDKIVDKGAGKGALLYSNRRVFDAATDALLASVRQVSFLRGDGGCGGTSDDAPKPHPIPRGSPDDSLALATRPEQALIYRLSGDYNPLHVDALVAAEAGLPRPILHGLCTYGILDCRFSAPVFPGERIKVSIWREAKGRAAFQAQAVDRDTLVLNNGYVEFEDA